uniref:Uncharacterized protein n=1 Tax=Tanacetum cinerariifolium TaxID=118510 RepID=A0A699RTU0_TANCI|nr:hypothetical protein [Tanacetum cinerariifolium]
MTVKHMDQELAQRAAILLTQELVDRLGRSVVLGPEAPYIFRIRLSREHTVLKQAKLDICAAMDVVRDQKEFRQARLPQHEEDEADNEQNGTHNTKNCAYAAEQQDNQTNQAK